jgi:hypothetical protein
LIVWYPVAPTSSKRPTAVSLKGPDEFRDMRGSGQKKHLCCQREIWRIGVLARRHQTPQFSRFAGGSRFFKREK